jgi:hypothetical protein
MRILNPAGIEPDLIKHVARRSGLDMKPVLFYLDDRENTTRRDSASRRINDYKSRGWQPNSWDLDTASVDSDHHAFFCPTETLGDQLVPASIKTAVGGDDSVIYLDPIFLTQEPLDVVSTLAHECRHAWQYYLSPLIYFGQTVLAYVRDPTETPAEIDAEVFAKNVSIEMFGVAEVGDYAKQKRRVCPAEHTNFWQRFIDLDPGTEIDPLKETVKALFIEAGNLKRAQVDLNLTFPQIAKAASYLTVGDRQRFLEQASKP